MSNEKDEGLTLEDAERMRTMAEYLERLADPGLLDAGALRVLANRADPPEPEFTRDDVEFLHRLASGLEQMKPGYSLYLRDMAARCQTKPLEDWERCRLAFQSHPRGGSEAWVAAAKAVRDSEKENDDS